MSSGAVERGYSQGELSVDYLPSHRSRKRGATLHEGKNVLNCCVIGYHGTQAVGGGSTKCNGNSKVQNFAWGRRDQTKERIRLPEG
jgi:hypothetical protein